MRNNFVNQNNHNQRKIEMNILKFLMIGAIFMVFSGTAAANDEGYIGEITIFAGNFAPRNHAFCDGAILPISQNQALFSILGTIYGGDGRTTFALPNLKEAEKKLKGAKYIIQINGIYPSRN